VKAHLAVVDLPCSDAFFVAAHRSEGTETFQQAHVSSLELLDSMLT
jgi:hypothetical protein